MTTIQTRPGRVWEFDEAASRARLNGGEWRQIKSWAMYHGTLCVEWPHVEDSPTEEQRG